MLNFSLNKDDSHASFHLGSTAVHALSMRQITGRTTPGVCVRVCVLCQEVLTKINIVVSSAHRHQRVVMAAALTPAFVCSSISLCVSS